MLGAAVYRYQQEGSVSNYAGGGVSHVAPLSYYGDRTGLLVPDVLEGKTPQGMKRIHFKPL